MDSGEIAHGSSVRIDAVLEQKEDDNQYRPEYSNLNAEYSAEQIFSFKGKPPVVVVWATRNSTCTSVKQSLKVAPITNHLLHNQSC